MSAAKKPHPRDDPPALRTALLLLAEGLWPIPITAIGELALNAGKAPVGKAWGVRRHTEDSLRAAFAERPDRGVGVLLGKRGGVVDVEVDDPEAAEDVLADLFGGEVVATREWASKRGMHYLFRFDDRLARYGRTVIKVGGVEIRIGDPTGAGKQLQSVCPPSPDDTGTPRRWVRADEIAGLPDSFFAYLDRLMPAGKPPARPATVPIYFDDRTLRRARAYVLSPRFPDAIEGQRGHDKIFNAACRLVDGFGLSYAQAMPILEEYNQRKASPPESEKQLDHKLRDALAQYPLPSLRQLGDPAFAETPQVGRPGPNFVNSVNSVKAPQLSGEEPFGEPRLHEHIAAPEFPLNVLPLSLAELCVAGAESVQCPVDYFAAAALALAGAVAGQSVCFKVKAHYFEGPALYLAMVGPPGTKKSPVLRIMARPLWGIDRDLRARYAAERRAYEARKGQPGAPEPPVQRQLTLDDTTREAVAQVHAQNPRGLALIKDELTAWVASLNAYREGKGDDLQFWLKVNSGSTVKVNRRGTPEPLIIPRPCVTIFGGLTPGTLPALRSGRDDGWIDRIMFSYPEPIAPRDWTDVEIPACLIEDWDAAVARLWARPMVGRPDGHEGPFEVEMTEDARAVWRGWINAHRAQLRDPDFPSEVFAGPWSKMESFLGRLALILSQLHQAYDPTDARAPRPISALDIWGATRLADYFKAHFRRARAELSGRDFAVPGHAQAVLTWIKGTRRATFSGRDARRNFPGRFGDNAIALADALEWLGRHECIRPIPAAPHEGAGRPHSDEWRVNPALLGPIPEGPQNLRRADRIDGIDKIPPPGGDGGEMGKPGRGDAWEDDTGPPVDAVAFWLEGFLIRGEAPLGEIIAAAAIDSYSPADLDRARVYRGIKVRDDERGQYWSLP